MNDILAAALAAWAGAQVVKVVCGLIRYGSSDKSRIIWRIIWAGGMPSVHSSVITAASVTILHNTGADSPLFGLAAVMCLIVIYDRSRMYSIYNTFQKRYPALEKAVQADPVLKDLVGHRVPEILAGIAIGAVTGIVIQGM